MRMTDAEAIMWAVEKDPALRSDFCNLTLLDRRPTEERLYQTANRGLAAIPRLRQRVVGAPLRIVPPEFADDPTLDVEAHVRVVGVPQPGDERAFLNLCGALSEQALDRARPLWEFTIIDGLPDGRAALLQKVHHTITDGEGGLRLSLAIVDFEREPEALPVPEPTSIEPGARSTPLDNTRQALADAARRVGETMRGAVSGAAQTVSHPTELPARAAEAARMLGSVQRQMIVSDPARSDVLLERSLRRRFTMHRLSLGEVRAVASSLGGSVNDVYITGLASALGRYHERFGSAVDELRLAMPVSTRERGDRESANAFAPVRVLVPVQPAHDVVALFKDVHDRLETAKSESAVTATGVLAGIASGLPTSVLVGFTRSQTRTVDFAASNLRGSPVPLYIAGARILANYGFGPRTGSPLNVTMMSYCDDLNLGCNIDPAAMVDVDGFMRDLQDAYDDLMKYA
jgi:diacylglycerol O-acyltransferase / wax synthase